MSYICPKCGDLPGPTLPELCICGSGFEEIDDVILKAFVPLFPDKDRKRESRWKWLVDMVGRDTVRKIAALSAAQRLSVIDQIRRYAIRDGCTDAQYSGWDFSVQEGEEFIA